MVYMTIVPATVADTGNGHILYELAPIPEQVDVSEGLKFGSRLRHARRAESRVGVVTWSPEGSEMWHYTALRNSDFRLQ